MKVLFIAHQGQDCKSQNKSPGITKRNNTNYIFQSLSVLETWSLYSLVFSQIGTDGIFVS